MGSEVWAFSVSLASAAVWFSWAREEAPIETVAAHVRAALVEINGAEAGAVSIGDRNAGAGDDAAARESTGHLQMIQRQIAGLGGEKAQAITSLIILGLEQENSVSHGD